MKNITLLFFTVLCAYLLPGQNNGAIDSTFADNGFYQANIRKWDILSAIALQTDGKIVGVGYSEKDRLSEFLVVRLLADGSPDTDFGDNGAALAKISPEFINEASAVALQADGKILVGGYATPDEKSNTDFALMRFTTDGQLDTSFHADGKVTLDIGSGDRIVEIAVLPDGKILAAGISNTGKMGFALARFLPDGKLDLSFANGAGAVTVSFGPNYDACSSMAVQPDGKILLVGYTTKPNGYPSLAIARFLPNGNLDTGFGSGGGVVTLFSATTDVGLNVLVQPDGKILVSGASYNAQGKSEMALYRYLSNGAADGTFGAGGRLRSGVGNTFSAAETILLRPDGKILVAGTAQDPDSGLDFAIKQFLPNGTVDPDFGTNGTITADLGGAADGVSDILFTPDGRILVAGTGFNTQTQDPDLLILRYLSDLHVGVLDAPQSVLNPWVYPNPISTTAVTVKYELREGGSVSIELIDMQGKLLSTLERSERAAGEQAQTVLLPAELHNGFYLLNIRAERGNAVLRILLNRQ